MGELGAVEAPGWAFLLKMLASMHISGADQDYREGVKQGVLKAIEDGRCDNEAVSRFVYSIIDHVTPLCQRAAEQKDGPKPDVKTSVASAHPQLRPLF